MEHTRLAAVVPGDFGWSDVGTWRAVWELSERDEAGNSVRGNAVVMDAHNVHVRSEEILTTVVGVDDVIVVTTQDAVLVLSHEHGDQVKQLVDQLKTEDQAVEWANDSNFGLCSSVWTPDEDRAWRIARKIQAGTTFINVHRRGASGVDMPYGGFKESGLGRGHGVVALEEQLEMHTLSTRRPA